MPRQRRKEFGEYIVADPKICHGALTFKGTRIFVRDVLEDVASGYKWDEIIRRWHNSVSREAISEAVQLARSALLKSHREKTPGRTGQPVG